MKAFMELGAGINHCLLTFFYEDLHGDIRSRNYNEVLDYCDEVFLSSSIRNTYYNCSERVLSLQLSKKPSISLIKNFINETIKCLEQN